MKKDTIFRIYSMTKPITGVAMMMLYEEGKWHPDDPLSRHIPEFASLRVFERLGADGKPETKAANHAPTVGELMTAYRRLHVRHLRRVAGRQAVPGRQPPDGPHAPGVHHQAGGAAAGVSAR